MNTWDMWLASTFDLPWSAASQAAPGASALPTGVDPASESNAQETLDIELLSELISAQDSNSSADSDTAHAVAQTSAWSAQTNAALWNTPQPGVQPITALCELLESEPEWVGSPSSQSSSSANRDPLLDSLSDIAAMGSLTLDSQDTSPPPPSSSAIATSLEMISQLDELETSLTGAPVHRDISRSEDVEMLVNRPATVTRSPSAQSDAGSEDALTSPPLKKKRKNPRKQPPKESMAYKRRREQNNQAVRRCRQKNKERNDVNQRVAEDLREENNLLKERVSSLFREVRSLRAMLGSKAARSQVASLGSTIAQLPVQASSCQHNNQQIWPGLTANFVM